MTVSTSVSAGLGCVVVGEIAPRCVRFTCESLPS
jgi:hypothetical protein